MAENLDFKSTPKPTLTTPSSMGKRIDKKFGSELGKVGLNPKNMSEESEENKSEVGSLKKKIFNLAKAETMIMQDEYLSGIYNRMKEGAREKFGYHWNEVIVNLIFNDHILNNGNYLQKYKNTTAYDKKRRGEEGVAELEKNVQDKIIANKEDGDPSDFGRTEKVSDVAKEKIKTDKIMNKTDVSDDGHIDGSISKDEVNELFGFGKPAPLTTHKPSENDMFIVDKKSNTAVGVISPNLSQQQNIETGNKFGDNTRYERMSWYSALQKGAKNVPPMPEEMKANIAGNKYTTQAYSNMPSYGAVREDGSWEAQQDLSKLQNDANDVRFSPDVIKAAEELVRISGRSLDGLKRSLDNGVTLKGILDAYKITDSDKADAIINRAIEMIKKNTNETTGASSSGQFTQGLDMPRKDDPIMDTTYQNELNAPALDINETTTTAGPGGGSSGTGQYSGPSAWAKNSKNQRFAHSPAWKGGEILQEAIKKGSYLTDPESFKKYVRLVESVSSIEATVNECGCNELDEAESVKQDALNVLRQIKNNKTNNPELVDMPEIKTLEDAWNEVARTGSYDAIIALKNQPQPMDEHHLEDRESKVQFILWRNQMSGQENGYTDDQLSQMSDDEINNIYLSLEKEMGMNETPNFEAAIKTDLEDGQGVNASNMSLDQAEDKDGLFKGKWNMNEEAPALSVDGLVDWAGKNILHATTDPSQAIQAFAQQNNISIQQLKDKAKLYATNAGLGLMPNGGEIKDVLMDLVAQIDEMLGTVPKQNTVKQTPPMTTNEMAPEIDNQTHFGDLKTKGLRKKIRVSELLALAQTQPELQQIEEFANSKGIEVDKLIELADQYLRNNLGYDDVIETAEQRALVDLIDAATPQEVEPENDMPSDDALDMPVAQDEPIAEVEQAGGDDTTVLAELGKILFPFYTDLPVEQLIAKVQNFLNSDQRSRGKDPKQILDLMKSKLGSMGMAESMVDDQPDSMINVSDTSMANTSDSPELNISGAGSDSMSMGTDSSSSIEDIKINEGKPYAGKELKKKMYNAKEKQEVKKEIKKELENKTNMNEEKKTPSMLNLEKIKRENATIANKEMASADALKQAKTYPDSENFYIEQDDAKVQKFQTAEELEKAALAKIKPKDEALHNDGDATANGVDVPKRNLSKEEMTKLAMERGDGMHNIVYDNEPSKKFEDRLKRDMGDDQYKLRQDKLKVKQTMPMYNKDTQPTEGGDDAKQFDKFKNGFNESYMGKYVDDFGKSQFVEFNIGDVNEVATINEGFKLNLDGLGNKYTQKVNENKDFQNITNDFEYYLLEDLKTVVKTKNDKSLNESAAVVGKSVNEGFDKMARLIGYNTNDFVNTKKSVKF